MPNLELLNYLWKVDFLKYCEELFSGENFKCPPNLSKVKVWWTAGTYDEKVPAPDILIKQFQQFLDAECSKMDFEDNGACVPGMGPIPFLDGRFKVFLFSTKHKKWVEFASAATS